MAQIYSGRDVGRFVEPLLRGAKRFLLVASPWISGEYARLLVEKARSGTVVYVVTSDARGNEAALRVFSAACGGGGGGGRPSLRLFLPLWLLLGVGVPLLGGLLAERGWWYLLGATSLLGLGLLVWLLSRGALLLIAAGAVPWVLIFYVAYLAGLSKEPPGLSLGDLFTYALLGSYTGAVGLLLWETLPRRAGKSRERSGWSGAGGLHVLVVPSRLMSHAKILVTEHGAVVGSANLTRSGLWRNMETVTVYAPGEAGPIQSQFWTVWEDARRNARSYIGCGAVLGATEWEEPSYADTDNTTIVRQGPVLNPWALPRGERASRGSSRRGERRDETGGEGEDPCGGDELLDLLLERGAGDPEVEERLRRYIECRAKWFIEHFDEWERRSGVRVRKE